MLDFNDSKSKHMPGYTGHIKEDYLEESNAGRQDPRKHIGIPGYKGYVPAIKAENMIGQTYGKCTYNSATGNYDKGIDLAPEKKFKSTFQNEYVD